MDLLATGTAAGTLCQSPGADDLRKEFTICSSEIPKEAGVVAIRYCTVPIVMVASLNCVFLCRVIISAV